MKEQREGGGRGRRGDGNVSEKEEEERESERGRKDKAKGQNGRTRRSGRGEEKGENCISTTQQEGIFELSSVGDNGGAEFAANKFGSGFFTNATWLETDWESHFQAEVTHEND